MRLGKSNTGRPCLRMEDEVRLGKGYTVDPVSEWRNRLGKSNTGRPSVRMEGEVWEE